jgi:hypothetical protein
LRIGDFVVPRRVSIPLSIAAQYRASHPVQHWDLFMETMIELFPEYRGALGWFDHCREFLFFNMFVCSLAEFLRYAGQLFAILEAVVARAGFPPEVPGARFQAYRYPGYLSERFFMYYLYVNRKRTFEAQLVVFEQDA